MIRDPSTRITDLQKRRDALDEEIRRTLEGQIELLTGTARCAIGLTCLAFGAALCALAAVISALEELVNTAFPPHVSK